jgi:hypothetical protein
MRFEIKYLAINKFKNLFILLKYNNFKFGFHYIKLNFY